MVALQTYKNHCLPLTSIIPWLRASTVCDGLVLFGSHAAGYGDVSSDVDLLVISSDSHTAIAQASIEAFGCDLDITTAGSNVIRAALRVRHDDNNNFMLNVLTNSVILYDQRGLAQQLVDEASTLYARGPTELPPRELEAIKVGLNRLASVAERLCKRASDESTSMVARMRCDQLVIKSLYLYFRVRGQWTNGMKPLLKRCEKEYPNLFALWIKYCSTQEIGNSILLAREISDQVFQ